jgi:hypothetical protein
MLWLSLYHVPFINNWSWNLVGIMLGDGVLVGFLLGVNGLVDHPDDHLVFERPGPGWSVIPTGLVLLIFGPVFFLAAAVFYLVFAFVQDAISKSILKIFAATAAIVLLSALMYPFGRASVLLLGGNVAFTGALIGWYIGSILRPEETILS